MFSHYKPMADNDAPGVANLDPRVMIGSVNGRTDGRTDAGSAGIL